MNGREALEINPHSTFVRVLRKVLRIYIEAHNISRKTVKRKLNIHKKKPEIRSVYAVLYQSQFKMDQNL